MRRTFDGLFGEEVVGHPLDSGVQVFDGLEDLGEILHDEPVFGLLREALAVVFDVVALCAALARCDESPAT